MLQCIRISISYLLSNSKIEQCRGEEDVGIGLGVGVEVVYFPDTMEADHTFKWIARSKQAFPWLPI